MSRHLSVTPHGFHAASAARGPRCGLPSAQIAILELVLMHTFSAMLNYDGLDSRALKDSLYGHSQ